MKLYTEEQVDKMLSRARLHKQDDTEMFTNDYLLSEETPIELPSDKEIDEMGKDVIIYNDTKRGWFIQGLKFMRDKIQGGNK